MGLADGIGDETESGRLVRRLAALFLQSALQQRSVGLDTEQDLEDAVDLGLDPMAYGLNLETTGRATKLLPA